MCGGRGQRLGPITKHVPKPSTQLNNRTIIEIKNRTISQTGI